ncbi:HNH endonuclease family protein [Brachyspira intermedia]|uniref:HNH endonuclease family protein n=1 Tax=Brachyspira intermedia TaxID=84377 RepID=UPI0030050BBE
MKYSINNINEIKEYLEELKEYSIYYNKLINPKNEKDKEISLKLYDIKSIEVNVSYPFFLNIYKDYNDKVIDKNTFINIINLIESFVFRRFICDIKTSQLNKIFAALYKQIKKEKDYYKSLEIYLFKFRFPNDNEIKNNLRDKDIYKDKNQQRKMYLFRKLEKGNSKEIVSFNDTNYTIEHIFPQQPTKEWKKELSKEDYKYMENKLHTIANLTISANNGELGNKTFSEKKNMNVDNKEQGYKYSRLWLNEYLKTIDEWNIKRIEERLNILSERFINIWKYPNIKIDNTINCEIDIFEADDPTGKKLEYIIFNGEKINITDVSKLFSYIIKYYYNQNSNFFFTEDMQNLIQITKNKDELRSEYPIEIDDIYFAENNYSSDRKFYLIKYIMEKFDLEDELYIKYKD